MIAALSGLGALVIGALTHVVIVARGGERLAAKLGSLLAAALTFAAVHTGHDWWVAAENRAAAAHIQAIDAAWQTDPVLAALKQHQSETYRFALAAIGAQTQSAPLEGDALISAGRHEINFELWFESRLKVASDASVIAYAKALTAAAAELASGDPALCVAYFYPTIDARRASAAATAVATLSSATRDADTAATAQVIANPARDSEPTADRVGMLIQPVLRGMYDEYGPGWQVINRAFDADVDPSQLCRVTRSFFRRTLQLPVNDAAEVLRRHTRPHA